MNKKQLIPQEVDQFYTDSSEQDRLKFGLGPLEWERNGELIGRYLTSGNSLNIADVGGGPGIYSEWLAKQGHQVFLIEPVQKHIEQADKRNRKLKNPFRIIHGEARQLKLEDESCDLVILHGPLYHLQEKNDRLQALREAKRILRPEGHLLAFAINETASTLVALLQGILLEPQIRKMCLEELTSGKHHAPKGMPGMLAGGFYHSHERLREELQSAEFSVEKILPVEGAVWLDKNYFETMGTPARKKEMLDFLRTTEGNESLLAMSPHLLAVCKK